MVITVRIPRVQSTPPFRLVPRSAVFPHNAQPRPQSFFFFFSFPSAGTWKPPSLLRAIRVSSIQCRLGVIISIKSSSRYCTVPDLHSTLCCRGSPPGRRTNRTGSREAFHRQPGQAGPDQSGYSNFNAARVELSILPPTLARRRLRIDSSCFWLIFACPLCRDRRARLRLNRIVFVLDKSALISTLRPRCGLGRFVLVRRLREIRSMDEPRTNRTIEIGRGMARDEFGRGRRLARHVGSRIGRTLGFVSNSPTMRIISTGEDSWHAPG